MSEKDIISHNVDQELNGVFDDIFNDKGEVASTSSPMYKKLINIEEINFINEFMLLQEEMKYRAKNLPANIQCQKVLRSQKSYHIHDIVNDSPSFRGVHFTITNSLGAKSLIFRIYKHVDYRTKSTFYNQQSIVYAENYTSDKLLKQTFFIDEPEENQWMAILTLQPDKSRVVVNVGQINNDKRVRISKKPRILHCENYSRSKPILNPSTHRLVSNDIDKCIFSNTEKWYEADMDGNVILIDLQAGELLLREVYFDTKTSMWKVRVKLNTKHNYLAFRITTQGATFARKLTPLEQGKFYYLGIYDFPCDKLKAAHYLEEDGSSEAYYYIAGIFIEEGDYQDIDYGLECLAKSSEQGFLAAQVDLAIFYYYNFTNKEQEIISLIKNSLEHEYAPAQFIAAYAYESGTLVKKDLKLAFKLYLQAATSNYAPALLRLSPETGDEDFKEDQLYCLFEKFTATAEGRAYAKYCLGRSLLGKVYIECYQDDMEWSNDNWLHINCKKGFQLLEDAANMNCVDAIFDVAFAYDFGEFGIEPDIMQALNWYRKIAYLSEDITLRISDLLLYDDTCREKNSDADVEAFLHLSKLLDNGLGQDETFDKLGLLYFYGIGCGQNYKTAKELFESASTGDSFFYLGCIYENGLGVESNISLAKQYYEKGIELKNENCIEKWNELTQKKITIFLSYAHADTNIANAVDAFLQNCGYEVKRDIRDVETWDSLRQFMQSIRKQDYAVLLVSDSYLRSDNCMYEIMQLIKDDFYEERVLPIVIESNEITESMYSMEYRIEIIKFWQERANKLKEYIQELDRENSAEIDSKYREIKLMAQNVSEFMETFFNEKLLISLKVDNIEEVVEEIHYKIQKHIQ